MKRIVNILFLLVFIVPSVVARSNCSDPETIQRLQELQRCIGTIKSKVTMIQNDVDDVSGIDELSEQISILGEVLCSKIENISVNVEISSIDVQVSGIEDLENLISINDQILCSKIEDLSEMVSTNDDLILSAIDNIQVAATVSGVDELISASDVLLCSKIEDLSEMVSINDDLILSAIDDHDSSIDALVCSKVGDLDDFGTCLETLIDLPDDIDNLNLNVIELLKTILLELRGCNQG